MADMFMFVFVCVWSGGASKVCRRDREGGDKRDR